MDENGKVPIGRPIFNSVAYVLDEQMQPLPLDKIGQLYVCSANLCDGYVGTKHKNFMPNKVMVIMTIPGKTTTLRSMLAILSLGENTILLSPHIFGLE